MTDGPLRSPQDQAALLYPQRSVTPLPSYPAQHSRPLQSHASGFVFLNGRFQLLDVFFEPDPSPIYHIPALRLMNSTMLTPIVPSASWAFSMSRLLIPPEASESGQGVSHHCCFQRSHVTSSHSLIRDDTVPNNVP